MQIQRALTRGDLSHSIFHSHFPRDCRKLKSNPASPPCRLVCNAQAHRQETNTQATKGAGHRESVASQKDAVSSLSTCRLQCTVDQYFRYWPH
ncbi:hypothetical protein AVEN_133185-1 [Araneus ventricosus]|uniref:Uncharacterized protein n=1 Tax=Araneus ventricosus TaxID=182803 RepID=A0A4Y2HPN8_ARAVE|nr:hypothetical protein AVEN_133185-1 [Araneus ventricosus]